MNTPTRWLTLVMLVLALTVTACSGPTGETGATTNPSASTARQAAPAQGGPAIVNVTAKNFAFGFDTKQTSAGPVTFVVTNNGSDMPHDFAIKGNGIDQKTAMINQGESASLTVDLKPGAYTYYCTIPGHDLLGMKGTFTVRP